MREIATFYSEVIPDAKDRVKIPLSLFQETPSPSYTEGPDASHVSKGRKALKFMSANGNLDMEAEASVKNQPSAYF